MNKHLIGITAFTLVSTAFAAATATAADSITPPLERPVRYSDLNLAHPIGAATLYRRIKTAADTVCSPFEGAPAVSKAKYRACVNAAIERAVKQVNKPLLTNYYLTLNPESDLGANLAAKY